MENKKYKVCRDDIYVGVLGQADNVYRYEGQTDFFRTKPGQLRTGVWRTCRSILFVPDENKLSNDLLYNTPSYPILNITDDEICLNLEKNSIVIRDVCNLAALLQYFGYEKDLTYEDILKIRKTFFTGRFAKDNCELFGYKETMAEDITFYSCGVEISDYKELEKLRKAYRIGQKAGHRMFTSVNEGILPRDYFDVLDSHGNNTLRDFIYWNERINSFAPNKYEGPVKRLKMF